MSSALITAPLPVAPAPAISPAETAPSRMHLEQIAAARTRGKKLQRAATVATFGGWMTAIFGVLTLATSLFSVPGLLLGAGMCAVSMFEFQGASKLRRLDRAAPRRLGFNQVFFGTLLFCYGAYGIWTAFAGPSAYADVATSSPDVARALQPFDSLTRALTAGIYGALMLIAIFIQGGTALYYFSRQRLLDEYVKQTPQWIADLQKTGIAV